MSSPLNSLFTDRELREVFNCKESTVPIYHTRCNTIFGLSGSDNVWKKHAITNSFWPFYRFPERAITVFERATQTDGSSYAPLTIKNWLDLLVRLFPAYKKKVDLSWEDGWGEKGVETLNRKIAEIDSNYILRAQDTGVSLDAIKEAMKQLKYAEFYSVLLKMYMEVPVRDDFQLKLVANSTKATEPGVNYIYPCREKAGFQVVINHSKNVGPDKRQQPRTYTLSPALSVELIEFIKRQPTIPEYLFGNRKLYKYVGKALESIGIPRGAKSINLLRRAMVTDGRGRTNEEIGNLAYNMCHTVATSQIYENSVI